MLTLGALWTRYSSSSAAYLDNAPRTREDAAWRIRYLLAYFGHDCDVRQLTADDQAGYATARRSGAIEPDDGPELGPVRARSAEADLILLHAMFNWARTVRVNGVRLLDANPLAGVKRPREANPK